MTDLAEPQSGEQPVADPAPGDRLTLKQAPDHGAAGTGAADLTRARNSQPLAHMPGDQPGTATSITPSTTRTG